MAGSEACAPRALLGPTPMVYPFIVNDPGEAAQAKRRLAAVTLGHRPPPMIEAGLSGPLSEVERLVDEFSSAEGLDPRRRKVLSEQIVDAAVRAGIAERCGVEAGMPTSGALMRIDAFLCDVKELAIRDGLHVLDDTELDAIVRALDGRFIEPGPAGAPSRGRSDVLPTGRNLFSVDPRSVPTPTAWANGKRAAKAILDRYLSDHGDWPRAIVLDLWGSATLRTGGEELATALALLGVRPVWDQRSYRVVGIETEALAELDRPRVDVTLRISGLFRDMFGAQLALFDTAVALVAGLREETKDNPLRAAVQSDGRLDRIFGPAGGSSAPASCSILTVGTGRSEKNSGIPISRIRQKPIVANIRYWQNPNFEDRVRSADAFVHVQDHSEIDLLTGGDFAAHEGGFAAAAFALGNGDVALYPAIRHRLRRRVCGRCRKNARESFMVAPRICAGSKVRCGTGFAAERRWRKASMPRSYSLQPRAPSIMAASSDFMRPILAIRWWLRSWIGRTPRRSKPCAGVSKRRSRAGSGSRAVTIWRR